MTENDRALADAISIAQTLMRGDKEKGGITPALIAEKVKVAATMLASAHPGGIDEACAVAELIRRFSHWIGRDSTLENDENHRPWLVSARKKDWRYWQRYQGYLERKLALDVVQALDESTDNILRQLEDPLREGAWDRRGLVVGHVQSGKTSNYSGLVCKAADAGYKIIIVLAGVHNNLRAQTQIRLEECFLGYETSANRDPGKPIGVAEIDSDPSIHPHCATTRADNGDFSATVARHFAITPEERPWLFVVKKQKTVLTQLLKWIRGHVADTTDRATGRRVVTKLPLLVIDDEADHASVDTGEQLFDADGKPDEEHQPKTINSLIRKILHAFEKSAYVGYTATPFANIFIHRRNETPEEGPDLFPEAFIVNLAAPSNYVGPARVFGLLGPEGRDGGLPLTRPVADHVNREEPGGWMPARHRKEHIPIYNGQEAIPPSLRNAICSFVLACAARTCRGQGSHHSSMLVHVTRFTAVQQHVHLQVEEAVRRMKQRITRRIDHEELLEQLRRLWEEDFVPTSAELEQLVPEADGARKVPAWDEIAHALPDVISDISVRTVNGTAKDALDYADEEGHGLKVIAIGGDKLARGLTLEGLCTSYFVRTTKMYDTLMQMGRWFGYRPGYVDLCRLYTSDDLVEWFGHIADASEELREEFDDMADRGAKPRDYGLKVQSHPTLLVTSPLKMRTAKSLQLSFSGELLETVSLFDDGPQLDRNLSATAQLIRAMGPPVHAGEISRSRGGGKHVWQGHLWQGIPADLVAEFLEGYATHPKATKVKSGLLAQFIRSMATEGELTSWTVVMLGGGDGGSYTFPGGITIDRMLKRKAGDPRDRYAIGRLLSPRDEAIDLEGPAWEAALTATRHAWTKDPGRHKDGQVPQPPELPNGPAIRRIRGNGAEGVAPAPERGLLLIYPLDPAKSDQPALKGRTAPVIAIGLSFPQSNSGIKVEYKVDHLTWERWEQEYGPTE
ncbi:Z1 domain-containing protein [Eleftheria terrae]|uniref:Z1 domain-containing protein n=1 Tax=Eleftheria terrae TaxID=1597781 RepID=UPI00263BB2E2|nr:Z1 domain-containing protein [Eleftheria terrae]WKB50756.1 Z1 domain-containing protein [Eleftheria terrae]